MTPEQIARECVEGLFALEDPEAPDVTINVPPTPAPEAGFTVTMTPADPCALDIGARLLLAIRRAERAEAETARLVVRFDALRNAIAEHHTQKADDRCFEDDDRLYQAAGLPPCDRRVGDKLAMVANCVRFVRNRCEGGGPWKSYADLEADNARLREAMKGVLAECERPAGTEPWKVWQGCMRIAREALESSP